MLPGLRVIDPTQWPVRVYRLGEEPGDDLSASTTADERLAMVALLSERMRQYVSADAGSGTEARVVREGGVPADAGELIGALADLSTPQLVVQLGLVPHRVDLLTSVSGIENSAIAWATRVEQRLGAHLVPILGRAELIANKRASGRLKDLADLEALGDTPR